MTDVQHFQISGFLTSALNIFLVLFVASRAPKDPLKTLFIYYGIAIAWWSFFVSLFSTIDNQRASYLFCQTLHASSILIPCIFFHFILHYLKKIETKLKFVLMATYATSSFFWILDVFFPSLFIARVTPKLGYPYFMDPGPFYNYWMVFFFAVVIYGHFILLQGVIQTRGELQKQRLFFFIGNAVGYFGGLGAFLPVYNITIFPYPYGTYGVALFSAVTVYSIVRYRLMDIEVIIKRTLVFAGLLAFVFGVFSFGLFIAQDVLATYFGFKWEAALAISIFLIVLGYEPMRAFLIETTDRLLFQKKYDYQKFLKDASRGIAQIESLHHLLGLVTHFITSKMRLKNAAVLMRDPKSGQFILGYQRGYPAEFEGAGHRFPPHSSLIRYLDREKEAIEIEQIKEYIETGGKKLKRGQAVFQYDFQEIKREMEELSAACCIPSFLGRELRNILILGGKKSGDYYSHEDLNVLYTIAQEAAIAIENARLYDEAINRSRELQKINEELEMARARLTHALQETEKANKQLLDTQAQLIHEQKMATLGRLAASVGHEVNNPLTILSMNVSRAIIKSRRDPQLKVTEILETFQKMEQNIGRIKAVVNTLTGLLKKSEKGKFEPLSLKLILEETLPLVQFQTYLDNPTGTDVEFDIPSSTPLIRGDLERLQEVFLNLFINAYHAMMGRRNHKIVVHAQVADRDPRMVEIDFTDNGCGMAEEIRKKIFTYGFTTKGPGRGSGMGLYMCKYIIELHGGDIKVKSQPGAGSTFTLTLPAYEEPSFTGISE